MNLKEKFKRMLEEKKKQLRALDDSMVESDDKKERKSIGETMAKLRDEINDIEEVLAEMDKPADDGNGNGNGSKDGNDDGNGSKDGDIVIEGDDDTVKEDKRGFSFVATSRSNGSVSKAAEKRAKAFKESGKTKYSVKEQRAVLVSSGKLATPTEVSGIEDAFNQVSSIVDLVKITDASGMGAYKVAYEKQSATADTQTEGGSYNESDPEFDFVTIQPQTEAVISYISKQARKQTPLNYEAKVRDSALTALRKKAASIITSQILASELNEEVELTTIDDKTLRRIAFNYGGDENVVGSAVLFLNKTDLIALGDVRGDDGKAVYEITPDTNNPNTGLIEDGGLAVKYCINSNLTQNTLIYGQPQNCELALFGDYDILVSEDFKFDKGLLAIRGDVELGADVIKNGGFVKATVTAAVANAGE